MLLREVVRVISDKGWHPVNVDVTIIAQSPKMAPYITAMRENLSADLGISVEWVSVKATTTEHLGFTGRGEGIAAQATALVARGE